MELAKFSPAPAPSTLTPRTLASRLPIAVILRLPILGHSTRSVTVLNIYTVSIFPCYAVCCWTVQAMFGLGTDVGAER